MRGMTARSSTEGRALQSDPKAGGWWRPGRWLLAGLLVLWVFPLTLPIFPVADSVGYLAPALSIVTDGDLLYLDEYQELGMMERYFRPTPRGLVGNHWNLGLGVALLPSYALSRLIDPSAENLSSTHVAAMYATILLWLGLLLFFLARLGGGSRRLDDPWPSRQGVLIAACFYLGTPLFFFSHVSAFMPHVLSALLVTLFVVRFFKCRQAPSATDGLVLGALCGAAFLVRSQGAAIIALPLMESGLAVLAARRAGEPLAPLIRSRLAHLVPMLVLVFGATRLSGAWSHLLYGPGNTGSLVQGLTDVEVALVNCLVHAHHGLLVWSPIVVPALIGVAMLARRDPRLFAGVLVFLLSQWWLNGTSFDQGVDAYHNTRHWAGGAAFGARRWLCTAPILVLGLTTFVHSFEARRRRMLIPLAALAVAWTANLAFYARGHLASVLEGDIYTPERLVALEIEALGSLPASAGHWLAELAPPHLALSGWLVALLWIGAGSVVLAAVRRLSVRVRRALPWCVASIALVGVPVGMRQLERSTGAAAESQEAELAAFAAHARQRTPMVRYSILVEQARLRGGTGHEQDALRRYEEAFEVGLGRHSVARYLELAIDVEGLGGAQRRLERLEAAYPGHPVLEQLRQGR